MASTCFPSPRARSRGGGHEGPARPRAVVRRIVWCQNGFFSDKQGGCQALPNGNVLVIESQTGRAFELTRAGETVWEFYNKEEEPGLRPTLRQMVRIGDEAGARLRRRLVP